MHMHVIVHDRLHTCTDDTPTTDDLTVSWKTNCKVDVGALHLAEALTRRRRGKEKREDEEIEEEGEFA